MSLRTRATRLLALALAMTLYSPMGLTVALPDYIAEKVAANTWVIHGPIGLPTPANGGFMNNPVFSVTETGVVVIDPGSSLQSGEMVLRQVAKITDKPVTHVFSTHIHGDHWLGNHAIHNQYPNAKFYAHPKMIELAHAGEAESWINLMEQLTEGATTGTKAIIPAEALENGQEIKVDGLTFRAHLTDHAHTKTDAMIEVVEDSVMVLGDNVLNRRLGRMDDGSFRGNIKACEMAQATEAKTFVPGHGPSGDSRVLGFCNYLTSLYELVGEQVEEGLSDFEMKPIIAEKLKGYEKWSGFGQEFGKHISLAVLEYEQA
ncbi:MAG: MBL fold metallo-hydrolase, partial [Gammaproteobacteria bacterium]